MSDNYSGNAPSANPITLANNFQKDLYPFSAFTFDDANTDSNPDLTLNSPWRLSATISKYAPTKSVTITTSDVTLTEDDVKYIDTLILSGATTGNRTLTIPAKAKKYTVINKCTGGYNITITDGGVTAVIPALSSSETSWQTYYVANIACDGTDVYDDKSWSIVGSSSSTGAVYVKFGSRVMICLGTTDTFSVAAKTDFGKAIVFPATFSSVIACVFSTKDTSNTGLFCESANNVGVSGGTLNVKGGPSACTTALFWIVIGTY